MGLQRWFWTPRSESWLVGRALPASRRRRCGSLPHTRQAERGRLSRGGGDAGVCRAHAFSRPWREACGQLSPLAIHLPRDNPKSAKYLSFKDVTLSGHRTGQDNRSCWAVSELEAVDLLLLLKVPRIPQSPARCPGLPARGLPCTPALGGRQPRMNVAVPSWALSRSVFRGEHLRRV